MRFFFCIEYTNEKALYRRGAEQGPQFEMARSKPTRRAPSAPKKKQPKKIRRVSRPKRISKSAAAARSRVLTPPASRRKAAYEPIGVFWDGARTVLFLRHHEARNSDIRVAVSGNGFEFRIARIVPRFLIRPAVKENEKTITAMRVSRVNGQLVGLYERSAGAKRSAQIAASADGLVWLRRSLMPSSMQRAVIAESSDARTGTLAFWGDRDIRVSRSRDLKTWKPATHPVLRPRKDFFDSGACFPIHAFERGGAIVLFYGATDGRNDSLVRVGAALVDRNAPEKILSRTDHPLWEAPSEWRGRTASPVGITCTGDEAFSYWNVDGNLYVISFFLSDGNLPLPAARQHDLVEKYAGNPIVSPRSDRSWESVASFNPAAIREDGKTHILYRAMGPEWISTLGYAATRDGYSVTERSEYPVYAPHEAFESSGEKPGRYMSGGGYGGCEDPRLTCIGDRVYMTYVAYDGRNPPRVALTSIARTDFLTGRWMWRQPVLISPPDVVDKNACILPEKIDGKYVIFHRIFPDILVDFVDDLESFDGATVWLEGRHKISPRPGMWDSRKVGVGPPPLKTKHGWLLIYQAVGEQDPSRYKIGAMLLDLHDPTKVLYRTKAPIIEPVEWYENEGYKYGVVYPCGAAIVDGTLFIYYGGADMVTCVASAPLETFLSELMHSETARLKLVSIRGAGI